MTKSANPAMTDPAPSVQPVRAWAVVGERSLRLHFAGSYTFTSKAVASDVARERDETDPYHAPHRVIRVEIREVSDE